MEIPRRLVDNAAVVTGAGHGIGRASAHGVGLEGAKVAVVDLRENEAQETVAMLKLGSIVCPGWIDTVVDGGQMAL